jgi:hypothetical protein
MGGPDPVAIPGVRIVLALAAARWLSAEPGG